MSAGHSAAQDMRETMQELRRDFTERIRARTRARRSTVLRPSKDVPTAMSPEAAATEFDNMAS